MSALSCVTMRSMTAQIYNMASTAASAISVNPLILVGLLAVVLAIVTGIAGRAAIVCDDLRYSRLFARSR
jgi:hypothetical protein